MFSMGCNEGASEAKPLLKGEKIELKDVHLFLQKLEKTTAIKSKGGQIVEAEEGKIIYIATFELENKSAETIYASDFGGGLYKKGSVKGDASVSSEIPGVVLSADFIEEGTVGSIGEVEAGATVLVRCLYYASVVEEYEFKIGERFSWKNLYLAAAADFVEIREALSMPTHLTKFMNAFNGIAEAVASILGAFGVESGSEINDQLLGVLLDQAAVVNEKDGCAYMTFKAGLTQREYDVCFNEDGTQLTKIKFRGLTSGVIRK